MYCRIKTRKIKPCALKSCQDYLHGNQDGEEEREVDLEPEEKERGESSRMIQTQNRFRSNPEKYKENRIRYKSNPEKSEQILSGTIKRLGECISWILEKEVKR